MLSGSFTKTTNSLVITILFYILLCDICESFGLALNASMIMQKGISKIALCMLLISEDELQITVLFFGFIYFFIY